MQKEIFKFIALPLALKVFKQDREEFKNYKVGNVYLDKIDAIIDQLQKDINQNKQDLITKHHLDMRYLKRENGKVVYLCKKEGDFEYKAMTFKPDELKNITDKAMRDYLFGENARDFERKERVWKKK